MNDDHYYEQLRREYERELDEDYRAWRAHAGPRPAPRGDAASSQANDSPAQSLGRAISSVVTVPASPEGASALGTSPRHVGGVYSRQTE